MNELNERIVNSVENILNEAMQNIAEQLPNDDEKEDFLNRLDYNMSEVVREVINGQDYREYLKRGAYETSVWFANHYADIALNRIVKEMPRGKNRDTIHNSLELLTHRGIESLCRGNSLNEIKADLVNCTKGQFKSYLASESQNIANEVSNSLYKNLKFSGRGSRKINRQIRTGTNIVGQELGYQVVDNFGDWIDGRKNFGGAVADVTFNTMKHSAITYSKQQGEEIAGKSLTSLAKSAENIIGKNIASSTLKKFANSNAVITTAGAIYDVGQSFYKLINGEISVSEFCNTFVEKGVDIVVQNAATTIGGIIGGAVGGLPGAALGVIVGSAINYFASNFLNSVVESIRNLRENALRAREEAEMARKRREFVEAFCAYAIRELEKRRLEFERNADEFLGNRRKFFRNNLNSLEEAIQNGDFQEVNSALNNIASGLNCKIETYSNEEEYRKFLLSEKPLILG